MKVMQAMVNSEIRRGTCRTAGLHTQERQALPVGAQISVFPTEILRRRLHQHGSSAITEDRTRSAVGVIHHRRHLVGSNHYDFLITPALNQSRSRVHREEEPAACSLKVIGKSVRQTQFPDDNGSHRREMVIRRGGRHNHAINLIRVHTGLLQQLLGSLAGHIARSQAFFIEDAPFLHADARHDPLIIRVNHARQLVVVQDVFRNVTADAGDYRIYLLHSEIYFLKK